MRRKKGIENRSKNKGRVKKKNSGNTGKNGGSCNLVPRGANKMTL